MRRALHSFLHLFVLALVATMTVSPVAEAADGARSVEAQLSGAPTPAVATSDCDEPAPAPATDAEEKVICGEGLLPSHVTMDPALFAMSAEDCESLLAAIYNRAACDPLDTDCGAVTPGAVPTPGPKLLGSGTGFTLTSADHQWPAATVRPLVADDDRVPASHVLEPPLRPPLRLV